MSGVGKATLLKGLARRGHTVVDTDDNGWVLDDGRWDELRMQRAVGARGQSGRVRHDPYGNRTEEQMEIAGYLETVEPLLRRGATLELDGRAEPDALVATVELLISPL